MMYVGAIRGLDLNFKGSQEPVNRDECLNVRTRLASVDSRQRDALARASLIRRSTPAQTPPHSTNPSVGGEVDAVNQPPP